MAKKRTKKAATKKPKPMNEVERAHEIQRLAVQALGKHLETIVPKVEVEVQKVMATLVGRTTASVTSNGSEIRVVLNQSLRFGNEVRAEVKAGVQAYGQGFRESIESSVKGALEKLERGRMDPEWNAGSWAMDLEVATNVNGCANNRSASETIIHCQQMTTLAHVVMALGLVIQDQVDHRIVGATLIELVQEMNAKETQKLAKSA